MVECILPIIKHREVFLVAKFLKLKIHRILIDKLIVCKDNTSHTFVFFKKIVLLEETQVFDETFVFLKGTRITLRLCAVTRNVICQTIEADPLLFQRIK